MNHILMSASIKSKMPVLKNALTTCCFSLEILHHLLKSTGATLWFPGLNSLFITVKRF